MDHRCNNPAGCNNPTYRCPARQEIDKSDEQQLGKYKYNDKGYSPVLMHPDMRGAFLEKESAGGGFVLNGIQFHLEFKVGYSRLQLGIER